MTPEVAKIWQDTLLTLPWSVAGAAFAFFFFGAIAGFWRGND